MAKNEYGVPLDKNGYAPSLMQSDQCCYSKTGKITAKRFHCLRLCIITAQIGNN